MNRKQCNGVGGFSGMIEVISQSAVKGRGELDMLVADLVHIRRQRKL